MSNRFNDTDDFECAGFMNETIGPDMWKQLTLSDEAFISRDEEKWDEGSLKFDFVLSHLNMYPCSDAKPLGIDGINESVAVYNERATFSCDLGSVAPRKSEHIFCSWVAGNDLQCK